MWSWFYIHLHTRGARCTPKPQLLLITAVISCNMKTNAVMVFYLF